MIVGNGQKLCIYGTDLHGKRTAYRQLFQLACTHRVKAIVLGGDLTPKKITIKTADDYYIPAGFYPNYSLAFDYGELADRIKTAAMPGEAGWTHFVECLGCSVRHSKLTLADICRQQKLLGMIQEKAKNPFSKELTEENIGEIKRIIIPAIKAYENHNPMIDSFGGRLEESAHTMHHQKIKRDNLLLSKIIISVLKRINSNLSKKQITTLMMHRDILGEYKSIINNYAVELEYQKLSEGENDVPASAQDQRLFLNQFLIPEIAAYQSAHREVKVFAQFGNDDIADNLDLFEAAHRQGVLYYLHNQVFPFISGLKIAGLSNVTNLPAGYKAWELEESALAAALWKLSRLSDPSRTVYVLHMPPINTALDCFYQGGNIGSYAVRKFTEDQHPALLLTGHVHGSPYISGRFYDLIGKTVCLNPGGRHNQGRLDGIIFDPLDPISSHTWLQSQNPEKSED